MHDPKTVAFEIYLGSKRRRNGNYKMPIITIWHNDPQARTLGTRSDDSCGWFSPPYTEQEKSAVEKLAKEQYRSLFARQVAQDENQSYAYVCYNQDTYGAIYWSWRSLKAMGKKGWQYGKPLTPKELDEIYKCATNPVDNFQSNVKGIREEAGFVDFFMLVWRVYRRFNRPWYKHPRWHIKHWSIQFHPTQKLKRRYWDKCDVCGKRGFKGSAYTNWDGDRIWHAECEKVKQPAQPEQQ